MSGLEETPSGNPESGTESGESAAPAETEGTEELNIGQERVLELISFVLVNMVGHPEDVRIDVVQAPDRDLYRVRVNPEDQGKIIGKGGQTVRALRTLLSAVSARTDQRVGLEIVE